MEIWCNHSQLQSCPTNQSPLNIVVSSNKNLPKEVRKSTTNLNLQSPHYESTKSVQTTCYRNVIHPFTRQNASYQESLRLSKSNMLMENKKDTKQETYIKQYSIKTDKSLKEMFYSDLPRRFGLHPSHNVVIRHIYRTLRTCTRSRAQKERNTKQKKNLFIPTRYFLIQLLILAILSSLILDSNQGSIMHDRIHGAKIKYFLFNFIKTNYQLFIML